MNQNKNENISLYIGDITFDVSNTRIMAEFWAAVLHYDIQEITDEFASVIHPTGKHPRCCFQKVPTSKIGKNRVHLDLFTSDIEAEVTRLEALGARKIRTAQDNGIIWTIMLDIENNEFCVQPPQW